MKCVRFFPIAVLCAAVSAFAQNATLSADNPTLAASGGTVTLTAVASYEGEPGALGWQIELPADWSLVSVSGPDVPAITPEAGTTGTLEFAFTSVPANRSEFAVVVRYPANAAPAAAKSTVLVRAGGKLNTLTPAVVQLSAADPAASRGQRARNN
jgi:hypothetical protein